MSTKIFCDICDKQITETNAPSGGKISETRLGITKKTKTGTLNAELITSWDGTANAGHFCKYCVLDAFAELDDRPKVG